MSGSWWTPIGDRAPDTLRDARLQAHWASQLVAAVGATWLTPRPDDSHPNMEWCPPGWLAGNVTETPTPVRVTLAPATLTLRVCTPDLEVLDTFELDTRVMVEARTWLEHRLAEHAGAHGREFPLPVYDIPEHPVGAGAQFSLADRKAFESLAAWFANGDAALRRSVQGRDTASPIRCWPHHFDLGTLWSLDPEADPETARSVGWGLSPGDANYDEPYFYVNPYPAPTDPRPPVLPSGGHWHAEGWFGAILTGSAIVGSGPDPGARVDAFLTAAVDAAAAMVSV